MELRSFGRHLHSQIVIPLLAVSVVVAIVATIVGVYRLRDISNDFIGAGARQALTSAHTRFEESMTRLRDYGKMVAVEPGVEAAARSGDAARTERALVRLQRDPSIDSVTVLNDQGRVVAGVGDIGLMPGDAPLTPRQTERRRLGMIYSTVMVIDGRPILTAIVPAAFSGRAYAVLISRTIDQDYLHEYFGGLASAVTCSVENIKAPVVFVDRDTLADIGSADPESDAAAIQLALSKPTSDMARTLETPGSGMELRIAGQPYVLRSDRVFGQGSGGSSLTEITEEFDPSAAPANIGVLVSSKVAAETSTTTVGLIAFWSVLAVLTLTGLGMLIARGVSSPLTQLSDRARRVADGEFPARLEIAGSNELSELADNFNAMTDSLRDRTESLTKKVLELATLYEMSRALGATLDLDTLLESVLDSALRIFDVDSGYVMLRDKSKGALELRAWRGTASSRPDERAIRSSMSEWVVRQGRPLIFNPVMDASAEEQVDSVTGALAALCVPLVTGDGVIGAIAVGSHDREFRFSADDVRLLSTIANHVTIAIGNIELFSSLQDAYLATVRSLASAVDAKDPYTRGHSDNVSTYAKITGERLGLSTEQMVALEMAAYLHDIGKIGVKESILLKPGRLDDDEMGQMRHHPLIGANILKPVAFPWPIAPVVRHHHEFWNGGGYPAGLKGEEIPLLARVLTVADAYEAMTADRPYRRGMNHDEAIEELMRCQGTQFDPRVVDALIEALKDLEEDEVARRGGVEDIQPEEVRAIFVAVTDGMFAGYRRLGGPRLATNLENDLNGFFKQQKLPFLMSGGHVTANWADGDGLDSQLEDMRSAIEHVSVAMERTSGKTLVDHFYDEALEGLSVRMRRLADDLDLYERS